MELEAKNKRLLPNFRDDLHLNLMLNEYKQLVLKDHRLRKMLGIYQSVQ